MGFNGQWRIPRKVPNPGFGFVECSYVFMRDEAKERERERERDRQKREEEGERERERERERQRQRKGDEG